MTAVTNVYVISEGERGEGSIPVAVAQSLNAARRYVYNNYHGAMLKQGESRAHWVAPRFPDNWIDEVHVHRLRLGPK